MSDWDPNLFTWGSLISGILAGTAFLFSGIDPILFLVGGILVALSGTCDSLDGIIARLSRRSSRKGDFLDHFFDRIVDAAILFGLAASPGASMLLGMFSLMLALLNSYLATQIEASFGSRSRKGIGKAEMFSGLVIMAVLAWILPGPVVTIHGYPLNIVSLFLLLLATLTLISMTLRIVNLRRLIKDQ